MPRDYIAFNKLSQILSPIKKRCIFQEDQNEMGYIMDCKWLLFSSVCILTLKTTHISEEQVNLSKSKPHEKPTSMGK